MRQAVTTEGLVLRRFDTGEADRVVWLLTPERGRVSAFAAAARRSRRRFAGALEPFTRLSVELVPPSHSDLFRLASAQILDGHIGIRSSLEATACASAASELVATLAVEGPVTDVGRGGYYEILLAYLRRLSLEAVSADDFYRFLMLALDVAGVRPRFAACARCGRTEATDRDRFAPAEGGRLCARCEPRGSGARLLPATLLAALRDFENGGACPLDGRELLWDYVQYQAGKPVKSMGLLQELGL